MVLKNKIKEDLRLRKKIILLMKFRIHKLIKIIVKKVLTITILKLT